MSELLFLIVVAILMPIRSWRRYRRKEPRAPYARYLTETSLLIVVLSAILWKDNIQREALGLSVSFSFRWIRDLLICLIVIVAPDILMVWRIERQIRKAAALPPPQGLAADALEGQSTGIMFFGVTMIGAIWEELCFRGTVFALLPQTISGMITGVIIGSLLFGAQHLRNGPAGMMYSTAYGVVFSILFIITHNLWALIIAHMLGNLLTAWQWAPRIEQARLNAFQKSLQQTQIFFG